MCNNVISLFLLYKFTSFFSHMYNFFRFCGKLWSTGFWLKNKISDYIQIEPMQITTASVLSFPGLEIKQNQRRVFQDGEEVSLTRLEYSTLVYLASNPGIVLTRTQIFEAVWNMESESCQSSVANVIYNLRKKIEPDSRKPTYIKTVLGMGYKFASGE